MGVFAGIACTCAQAGASLAPSWQAGDSGAPWASQEAISSDIALLNFSAPTFTWLGPVTFTFTIDSNVSVNNFYIAITSTSGIQPVVNLTALEIGLNVIEVETSILFATLPGDKQVNITLSHGSGTLTFTHVLWVGSSFVLAIAFFAGTVIIIVAIVVKYGAAGSSPSTTGYAVAGNAASPAGDDSTVTYVDQSRAPAGSIFCPECKKVIEEGSIFCPECGTRIPRYLRYKP